MNTKSKLFTLFVVILLLGCGDEEEMILPENFLNLNSTAAEYKSEFCGVELRGSIESSPVATELGFVYSYENTAPTFADIKLVFREEVEESVFTAVINDYDFPRELFWRAYAIINGEVLFASTLVFSESISIGNLSRLFSISFDCTSSERQLVVSHSLPCPIDILKYEVCMTTVDNTDCTEYAITADQSMSVPIDEDVNYAEVNTFRSAEPEIKYLNKRIILSGKEKVISTNHSPIPLAVAESTGFRIGEFFYLCGGYTESNSTFTNALWRYEFTTDEWVELESFPGEPRAFMFSSVINGIAYVGSGGSQLISNSDFYSYDPATNIWQRLAIIPDVGIAGVSFVLNDNIYVTNLINQNPTNTGTDNIGNQLFVYNTTNNFWSTLNSTPFNIQNARNMAAVVDQRAYFINTSDNFTEIWEYNADNDDWNFLKRPYIRCDDGVAFTKDNSVYITTGRSLNGLYELNLETFEERLFCLSDQEMRSEAVGTFYEDKVYIFGGLVHDLDSSIFTEALESVYSIELPD